MPRKVTKLSRLRLWLAKRIAGKCEFDSSVTIRFPSPDATCVEIKFNRFIDNEGPSILIDPDMAVAAGISLVEHGQHLKNKLSNGSTVQ